MKFRKAQIKGLITRPAQGIGKLKQTAACP
jgi:hypothetical protein